MYEIGDWIKIFVSSIVERHTFQTEDMSYSRLNMSVVQDLKDDFGTLKISSKFSYLKHTIRFHSIASLCPC